MPKTHSSKLAKSTSDQGQRFDPLFISSRLKRWKKDARALHQSSLAYYKEIKAYVADNSDAMSPTEKETVADLLSINLHKG